jgi:hypothetical protein
MKIVEYREYEDRVLARLKVADSTEAFTFSRWTGIKMVCNYPGWNHMGEQQKHKLVNEILDAISRYERTRQVKD